MFNNFRTVLNLVIAPIISVVWGWFIVSIVVTQVIFVLVGSGFGQIPTAFFTALVTLDSLLIAVTGLIASIIVVSIDIREIQKSFETKSMEEGPNKWVRELVSLAVATGPLFLVMLAVTPYFISAIVALLGLLMPEGLSLYFAAISFWITLATFLSVIAILWKTLLAFWGAQKEKIGKLLVYALKKYGQSKG